MQKKNSYDALRPAAGKKRGDIFAAWPVLNPVDL